MKKSICLLAAAALLLTGCNDVTTVNPDVVYGISDTEEAPVDAVGESIEDAPPAEDVPPVDTSWGDDVPADKPITEPVTEEIDPPVDDAPPATATRPEETTTARPVETDIPFEKSAEQLRLEQLVAANGTATSEHYSTDAEVIPLFFGDLDSDGAEELVALYGGIKRSLDSSDRFYWGEVWFASGENVMRLDRARTGEYTGFELINNADGVFLSFEDTYPTGTMANSWIIDKSWTVPVADDDTCEKTEEQQRLEQLVLDSIPAEDRRSEWGLIKPIFSDLDNDSENELLAIYAPIDSEDRPLGWGDVWFAAGEKAEKLHGTWYDKPVYSIDDETFLCVISPGLWGEEYRLIHISDSSAVSAMPEGYSSCTSWNYNENTRVFELTFSTAEIEVKKTQQLKFDSTTRRLVEYSIL